MSEWTDDNDEPLGEWEEITAGEYLNLLGDMGPEATVFASRTEVGERHGEGHRSRIMHTEWGMPGEDAPRIRCHNDWDYFGKQTHLDSRFVRRVAS